MTDLPLTPPNFYFKRSKFLWNYVLNSTCRGHFWAKGMIPLPSMVSHIAPQVPINHNLVRVTSTSTPHQFFLPIEFMKLFPDVISKQVPVARTFTSSGTTQSSRSQSYFSAEGLELYKAGALATFFNVLRVYHANPLTLDGISLVPDLSQWPHSSLAQMVAWIGEYWHITYATLESLPDTVHKGDKPVFFFATALHLVGLLEKGVKIPLPKGSVIIETGGYKGKAIELSRDELYCKIAAIFDTSTDYIISEYGMCETASQAYDWVDQPSLTAATPLNARYFRFPPWVDLFIMAGLGKFQHTGHGALVIDDPLRVDFPWPLRSQDMAELHADGLFKIAGRVPGSVLKGCSMNAEEFVASKGQTPSAHNEPPCRDLLQHDLWQMDERAVRERIAWVQRELPKIFADKTFIDQFNRELAISHLGESAIKDLQRGMPAGDDDWRQAILQATGGSTNPQVNKNWLMILPRAHPQALFHPLLIGYVAGIRMYVRKTSNQPNSIESIILNAVSSWPRQDLQLLSPDFRIGASPMPFKNGSILCFGSNETVQTIKNLAHIPVNLFGTTLSGVLCQASDLNRYRDEIVKDCFSLAQKGCYSARFIIVLLSGSLSPCVIERTLVRASRSLIGNALSPQLMTALDHEALHVATRGGSSSVLRSRLTDPLFYINNYKLLSNETILNNLSDRQLCVPIFTLPQGDFHRLPDLLFNANSPIKRLSISHNLANPLTKALLPHQQGHLCNLGEANSPSWNGLHDGKPFFVIDTNKTIDLTLNPH